MKNRSHVTGQTLLIIVFMSAWFYAEVTEESKKTTLITETRTFAESSGQSLYDMQAALNRKLYALESKIYKIESRQIDTGWWLSSLESQIKEKKGVEDDGN